MAKRVTKNQVARQQQQDRQVKMRRWLGLGLMGLALAIGIAALVTLLIIGQKKKTEEPQEAQTIQYAENYEAVIQQYYKAILEQDGKAMSQILAPPEYWVYYMETYQKSEDEVIETLEEAYGSVLSEWQSAYGSDLSLSYEIIGVSPQGQEGLDEWNQQMASMLGNDGAQITQAMMVEVVLTISGQSGSETMTYYPTIAQMGDGWYMLEEDSAILQDEMTT